MTIIDDSHLARAALSWLVEPGSRWVADRIRDAGPVAAAQECLDDTDGRTPLRAQVQRAVRYFLPVMGLRLGQVPC